MKEAAEPLPLVPAIWMGLRRSKSEGCCKAIRHTLPTDGRADEAPSAHLIAYAAHPRAHVGKSSLVGVRTHITKRLHDGEVALQAVERCHGRVVVAGGSAVLADAQTQQ